MKLMNELESEVAGTVVRAYVENGRPVEYGQSLFAIEPLQKKVVRIAAPARRLGRKICSDGP